MKVVTFMTAMSFSSVFHDNPLLLRSGAQLQYASSALLHLQQQRSNMMPELRPSPGRSSRHIALWHRDTARVCEFLKCLGQALDTNHLLAQYVDNQLPLTSLLQASATRPHKQHMTYLRCP